MPDEQYYNWENSLRQKADEYDVPFEAGHWAQMERLLDGRSSRRPVLFWLLLLPDVGTVLLLGLLFFTVRSLPPVPATVQHEEASVTHRDISFENEATLNKNRVPDKVVAENKNEIREATQPLTSTAGMQQPTGRYERAIIKKQNVHTETNTGHSPPYQQRGGDVHRAPRQTNIASDKGLPISGYGAVGKESSALPTQNKQTSSSTQQGNGGGDSSSSLHIGADAKANPDQTAAVETQSNHRAALKQVEPATGKKWSVTAAMGAELSFARGGKLQRPGLQYGLMLGYAATPTISIQTGLMLTNKLYVAGGNAYKADPSTYWGQVKINEAYADCNVLEIPLRVVYTPASKKFYYSAGLYAAVMQKEVYRLYYTAANGDYRVGYPQYAANSLAPLAFTSLGVGKRFAVAKRMALMVEPQLKLPLRGVGEGNIKLWSAGLQLGLQWK